MLTVKSTVDVGYVVDFIILTFLLPIYCCDFVVVLYPSLEDVKI